MSEYLSKEEIKQWRSSLEKITLEEYAARLGKKLEQDKPTKDLVDIVLKGQPVVSRIEDWTTTRGERISSIAERAYEREREIAPSPFSAQNLKSEVAAPAKKTAAPKKAAAPKAEKAPKVETKKDLREEVRIVFKKALTDREQKVFDYFAQNSNKIVYAKDLAALLDLPRDYVYKYIKNLRAKIEGDNLKNADKGGFVLSI